MKSSVEGRNVENSTHKNPGKQWFITSGILVASAVAIYLLLGEIRKQTGENVHQSLETVLNATLESVRSWRDKNKLAAETLAGFPEVVSAARAQLRVHPVLEKLRASPFLKALDGTLEHAIQSHGFVGYILINRENVNVASLLKANIGDINLLAGESGILARVFQGRTEISLPLKTDIPLPGLSGELSPNATTLFVITPLYDESRKILGALAFRLDPSAVFLRIFQISRLGQTGESYALDKSGRLLTESRFDSHLRQTGLIPSGKRGVLSIEIRDPGGNMVEGYRPGVPRSEQPLTFMADQVTRGMSGHNLEGYRDYRGVPVLGVWKWIEDWSMGITVEIDEAEAWRVYGNIEKLVLLYFFSFVILFIAYSRMVLNQRDQEKIKNLGLLKEIEKRHKAEENEKKVNGLLEAVAHIQTRFIIDQDPQRIFHEMHSYLLHLSNSEYGFIGEVMHTPKGDPYLKTRALSNISWNPETRELYEKNFVIGLEFHDLETLFGEVIVTRKPVISNDPATDSRSGGLPMGHPPLTAFLGLPLFKDKELVGMVGLANCPGGYDENLPGFLRPALDACANIISAYRDSEARQKLEIALKENEAYCSAIINNMVDGLVVIDQNGRVESFNPAAERIFGYSAPEVIGRNVSMLMPEPFSREHDQHLRNYLETGRGKIIGFGREVPAKRKDGSIFPIELAVSELPLSNERKSFVGTIKDLTRLKETEEVLAKEKAYTQVLQIAGTLANEAMEIEGSMKTCLDLVCHYSGWPVGHYYGLDERPGEPLISSRLWHLEDPERFRVFREITEATRFERGVGLSGRVLATGKPVWIEDVTIDPNFPRAKLAENIGVKSAFAFPVLIGNKTAGVVEIFHPERKAPDEALLALAGQIGIQMGRVVERGRQDEKLKILSTAVEQSPSIVMITNVAGNIEYVNSAFSETTGYAPHEVIGQSTRMLKSGKHSREFYRELWDTILSGVTWRGDFCSRKKNGDLYWNYRVISPIINRRGDIIRFVSMRVDDTERKRAEEALRQREAELSRAQKIARLGSWEWEIGEDRMTLSEEAARILGLEPGTTTYAGFLEAIHPDDRGMLDDLMFSIGRLSQNLNTDFRVVSPIGQYVYLEASVADCEQGLHVVGIVQDISERKNAENRLRHAMKLESIGELTAGIAHEINTPLQFIGDNVAFLRDSFEVLVKLLNGQESLVQTLRGSAGQGEIPEKMEIAFREADFTYLKDEIPVAIHQTLEGVSRVTTIVGAMKAFSHPGDGQKKTVNINRVIETAVTVSRNEWKYVADVSLDLDPGLVSVPCVESEISQVILNMVVNAAHAIEEKLGKNCAEKGTIAIATCQAEGSVEIRIRDTGAGIPEKVRPRIFDPFFTTKAVGKGTGQGLSIIHGIIVKNHQGSISFETEEGKGTEFVIRLPLADSQKEVGI